MNKQLMPTVLILAFMTSTLFTSCFIDDDNGLFGCVDGDGPSELRELDIDEFDEIVLTMDAEIILTQGDEQSVMVDGKPNIIDEIERDVHHRRWTIEPDDCVRDVGNLVFFITIPHLRMLKISGPGEIYTDNTFLVGDMDLEISGSGEIDMGLEADDLDIKISGSGKILLEGIADEMDASISGSGDIRAFEFPVRDADINISGSGDAEVHVDEFLRIRITGSGDVYYRGQPALDISISGSGDVVDAN